MCLIKKPRKLVYLKSAKLEQLINNGSSAEVQLKIYSGAPLRGMQSMPGIWAQDGRGPQIFIYLLFI